MRSGEYRLLLGWECFWSLALTTPTSTPTSAEPWPGWHPHLLMHLSGLSAGGRTQLTRDTQVGAGSSFRRGPVQTLPPPPPTPPSPLCGLFSCWQSAWACMEAGGGSVSGNKAPFLPSPRNAWHPSCACLDLYLLARPQAGLAALALEGVECCAVAQHPMSFSTHIHTRAHLAQPSGGAVDPVHKR